MILTRHTAVLADGLGNLRPQATTIEFPNATDVTIPGVLKHSDGTIFNLTGAYTLQLGIKKEATDSAPLVSRQATITDPTNGLYEFYISSASDRLLLIPGLYACDVILIDSTGPTATRNEVLPNSRLTVTLTVSQPGDPITPLTRQQPLALGPTGAQGPQGVAGPTGPIGVNWRGTWSGATAYAANDGVSYTDTNGGGSALSSFVCLVPNTNVPPVDGNGNLSADWGYVAQRGGAGINSAENISESLLNSTNSIQVFSYTPTQQGNFQLSYYYRVINADTSLSLTLTYTDSSGALSQTLLSSAFKQPVGSYQSAPVFFNSTASAVVFTAKAGTANNVYISCVLTRYL